jgi:hypothetical protein
MLTVDGIIMLKRAYGIYVSYHILTTGCPGGGQSLSRVQARLQLRITDVYLMQPGRKYEQLGPLPDHFAG